MDSVSVGAGTGHGPIACLTKARSHVITRLQPEVMSWVAKGSSTINIHQSFTQTCRKGRRKAMFMIGSLCRDCQRTQPELSAPQRKERSEVAHRTRGSSDWQDSGKYQKKLAACVAGRRISPSPPANFFVLVSLLTKEMHRCFSAYKTSVESLSITI